MKCEDCDKPATKKIEHPGCPYCGGGDCGDGPDTEFLCDEHAKDRNNVQEIVVIH